MHFCMVHCILRRRLPNLTLGTITEQCSRAKGNSLNGSGAPRSVLETAGIRKDQFEKVCVLVDKLDKIGADEVVKQLMEEGLDYRVPRARGASEWKLQTLKL